MSMGNLTQSVSISSSHNKPAPRCPTHQHPLKGFACCFALRWHRNDPHIHDPYASDIHTYALQQAVKYASSDTQQHYHKFLSGIAP